VSRSRRARSPRPLSAWGLASLFDGDQRGPYVFDRIATMAELRELEEFWRTIAAVLSDPPLAWPFTDGDPAVEEAQRAVLELARFTMNHKTVGAPVDFEPYVVIKNLKDRYELRLAVEHREKDRAGRASGGRGKAMAGRAKEFQDALDAEFRRAREGFKVAIARERVAKRCGVSRSTIEKYTHDPRTVIVPE
jgi:hypothetical protein